MSADTAATVSRFWLPAACALAGFGVGQWLLSELRFSNVRAELVFRALFFAPALLDGVLLCRRCRRRLSAWRSWSLAAPVWLVAGAMASALAEGDAQGAILVFILPFGHVMLSGLIYLLTRSHTRIPA